MSKETVTVGEEISARIVHSMGDSAPLVRKIADTCMPCGLVLGERDEGTPRPKYPETHASPEDPDHQHPVVVVEYDVRTVMVAPDRSKGTYAKRGRPLE